MIIFHLNLFFTQFFTLHILNCNIKIKYKTIFVGLFKLNKTITNVQNV